MIALLLTVLLWHPGIVLWTCYPGKTPMGAPSNCERLHYDLLWKFPTP